MNKQIFSISLLFFVFINTLIVSQTITSTSYGGNWESGDSWIGGLVPGENNDVVITSTISITSSNSKCKNLTINAGGILQNGGGLGWVSPTIMGNITNNGTIRNNPEKNELWLYTFGDLHNNGIWKNSRVYFSSNGEQKISQSDGKKFEAPLRRGAPTGASSGSIIAASNITFANYVDLQGKDYIWSILDMSGFDLTLEGEYYIRDLVINNGSALISNESFSILRTYFDTDIIIEGILSITESNVTFGKNCTVNGILQNGGGLGWVTVYSNGTLYNNGIIRNNPAGKELWLNIYGNAYGSGKFINSRNYVETNGDDNRINGNFFTQLSFNRTGNPKGGEIIINGELNSFGRTDIQSGTIVSIAGNGKFFDYGQFFNYGSLYNNGIIFNKFYLENSLSFNYFSIGAAFQTKPEIDSIIIESYGNQVPSSFGNAVKNWWRIKPSSENPSELFTNLTLRYTEELLNNNNEEELQIFHSADSGKTWKQISSSGNLTRDINNNYLVISAAPAFGDFILSSEGNPYSVRPSIVVSILGRSQLRIGPPNRFTIHYANNSSTPTEDFFFTVSTGSNTRILSAELPMSDGKVEVIPIDSINMEYNDKAAMFFLAGLEPQEEGSFDIICTGEPLSKESRLEPFSMVAIGVLTVGTVIVIDYVGGKAIENTSMSDEDKAKLDIILSGEVKKEIQKEKSRGVKVFASRKIGLAVLGKVMGVVGGVFEIGAAVTRNIKGVFQNLYDRAYLFIQQDVGYFGVQENEGTIMTMGGKKDLIGVTSWDPNEKIGPNGFGVSKHISVAGKMNYQILFENKKEATGAAYKIVIIDTLSSVFDPTTVEFGRTSHTGFSFKREENILTWEIIGIELPPNANPPEGEGWVSFSVNTKPDLVSGTLINNKASITFDVNAPIITNVVTNVLDYEPPTTQLSQSILSNSNDELILKWSANDGANGSGISSTTIFCSIDGGPYAPAVMTFEDSAKFTPQYGNHRYSFYAMSEDNVGNLETIFNQPITFDFTTSVESDDINLPDQYSLSQNFPNPFNPSTTINYSIPQTSKVTLKIFDILGREIVTLVNIEQSAGNYSVNFNAESFSSGIYFYNISAGNYTKVKKMLLIK